jgi:membrane protein
MRHRFGRHSRLVGPVRTPVRFLRAVIGNVTSHHTLLATAGVAYYFALALVPAVVAVVSIYGLVAKPEDVAPQLAPLTDVLPTEAGDLLVDQLSSVSALGAGQTTLGVVVGFAGLIWLVSNALNSLIISIRITHELKSPHNWLQGRLFAIKLSLVAVVVTSIVLWLVIVLPQTLDATGVGPAVRSVLSIGRWPFVLLLAGGALAWIYRMVLGPKSELAGRFSGVVIGTVIWIAGTVAMARMATNADQLHATFGTLGAVAILLFWLYLSAAAVLIGAEANAAILKARVNERALPPVVTDDPAPANVIDVDFSALDPGPDLPPVDHADGPR